MLIIAPDLIEAMLEILQKTRSLATALAVVELQQQIIQAVYIKVRPSLFLFVCVCVCPLSSLLPVCPRVDDCMGAPTFRRMHLPALPSLPRAIPPTPRPRPRPRQDGTDTLYQLPHLTALEVGHITKGKGSIKGIAEYLRVADDAKKGLADFAPQRREDVLRVRACVVVGWGGVGCWWWVVCVVGYGCGWVDGWVGAACLSHLSVPTCLLPSSHQRASLLSVCH